MATTLMPPMWAVGTYRLALSELQRGLAHLPDDTPEIEWIEAYWLVVDADFSSAGFIGRAADGIQVEFK